MSATDLSNDDDDDVGPNALGWINNCDSKMVGHEYIMGAIRGFWKCSQFSNDCESLHNFIYERFIRIVKHLRL